MVLYFLVTWTSTNQTGGKQLLNSVNIHPRVAQNPKDSNQRLSFILCGRMLFLSNGSVIKLWFSLSHTTV